MCEWGGKVICSEKNARYLIRMETTELPFSKMIVCSVLKCQLLEDEMHTRLNIFAAIHVNYC